MRINILQLCALWYDYSHSSENLVMKLTTLVGIKEQRFLVSLLHSRAMWERNEYQKVFIFITLPDEVKEMPTSS